MQIKICGLFREEDIEAINAAAPDWAGFIIDVPFSHRSISASKAKDLVTKLSPGVKPVGVFFNATPEHVADAAEIANFHAVQLHGEENEEDLAQLRRLLDERSLDCRIWKAFKVKDAATIAQAQKSSADVVLLDGGTGDGRTFNWDLCSSINRPFIVAGGLDPENIEQALTRTGAFACDLSSGVETEKLKDPAKINAAVNAARSVK